MAEDAAALTGETSPDGAHGVPAEGVQAFEDAFNAGDIDLVTAMYVPGAVFVTGPRKEASGPDAVRRRATFPDVSRLSATLAAAFFEDPLASWCVPDGARRREILPAFFRVVVEAALTRGEVYTTDDGVAAAVWLPPGGDGDAAELLQALAEVSGEYADRVFTSFQLMAEKHPLARYYYLFFLGTRPEWQCRGIGSALMVPVLHTCDGQGLPAYLEASSERNKRLYLRHGFEVVGDIPLPGGPTLWCMWRPAGDKRRTAVSRKKGATR